MQDPSIEERRCGLIEDSMQAQNKDSNISYICGKSYIKINC